METAGVNPMGLAGPAQAQWHLAVDGRQYALFDAAPDDLSFTKLGDFEDRVHSWYEGNVTGLLAAVTATE